MSSRRSSRIAVCTVALLITTVFGAAQAAANSPKAPSGAAAPTKKLPGKVTFQDAPSAEKPAARAKRLKRECKGRPNAGMCLGHAS